MPDADKILEAEQSIQNIAAELKKMRNAASLLQSAAEKTDAILNTADSAITVTKEFSHACEDIIRRLSATDLNWTFAHLNQRLDTISAGMNQIAGLINQQEKRTSDAIATIESKLAGLDDALQAVAKESRKRHTISVVFIILTLIVALTALVATLLRGIGG